MLGHLGIVIRRALRPRLVRAFMGLVGLLAVARGAQGLTTCGDNIVVPPCFFVMTETRNCCHPPGAGFDVTYSCNTWRYHKQTSPGVYTPYWTTYVTACTKLQWSCTPFTKSC